MANEAELFELERMLLVKQVIPASIRSIVYRYILDRRKSGSLREGDHQVPHTPADYGDSVTDLVLAKLVPTIEKITGLKLFPTYSYFRVYKKGDRLERHCDRPACEISLSVNMGQSPSRPWPLWIERPAGVRAVKLEPGD